MAKKVAVIGSGPMGLTCAYELLKNNYQVDVYEKDDRIGGMSACFDFDGLTIERYYHFICRTDRPLFDLLKEFSLSDKLHWRDTKMGFFYRGALYKWGNPFYLFMFPKLGFISKLRYALHIMYTKHIDDWSRLDQYEASAWLKKWVGQRTYQMLWDYLFQLKFYEYKANISAAWIGTRIKRVALSRKNILTENLGYLEGGSDTLLRALERHIINRQGTIHINTGIDRIIINNHRVQGVMINGQIQSYDQVVSTIPLPYLPKIAPDLPEETISKIKSIHNCGVVCVVLKLSAPLTENFWLNINEVNVEIPGLIEYSNLYPLSENIVYVPFYMPHTHPKYRQHDTSFINEVMDYIGRINSNFSKDWVLAAHVSRYEFAQPICVPHFFQHLPPMKTPVQGFVMADTSYSYPEDRSISESIRIGKMLANLVDK